MDLQNIPDDLLLARGKFSTVRAEHEDQLKRLQVLTGQLSSAGSQILRFMQPADGELCDITGLLKDARTTIDEIEKCAKEINILASQRTALKVVAWPKK